jgi:NAD(P)-dependent dehydrogenase (short-subunit alcohol dehydrogenase family)
METHPTPTPISTSTRRTVLITGTSSGIGLAAAIAAAEAGWNTIATMRDLSRSTALRDAAEVSGVELDIQALDVTDGLAVGRVIAESVTRYGRLDAVVNNAGSPAVGTVETMDIADFRSAMEVNFFGVVLVTRAAMPHLRASGGRVVTISSVGGVIGQPFNEAYCAAKFAVEGFLESLHPVAMTVGVDVCLIEPGAVASEFVANARIDPAVMLREAGPYAPALQAYLDRTQRQFSGATAQSPEEVARLIVDTLDSAAPAFRVQTTAGATDFVSTKLADLDGARVTTMTAEWVSA